MISIKAGVPDMGMDSPIAHIGLRTAVSPSPPQPILMASEGGHLRPNSDRQTPTH